MNELTLKLLGLQGPNLLAMDNIKISFKIGTHQPPFAINLSYVPCHSSKHIVAAFRDNKMPYTFNGKWSTIFEGDMGNYYKFMTEGAAIVEVFEEHSMVRLGYGQVNIGSSLRQGETTILTGYVCELYTPINQHLGAVYFALENKGIFIPPWVIDHANGLDK